MIVVAFIRSSFLPVIADGKASRGVGFNPATPPQAHAQYKRSAAGTWLGGEHHAQRLRNPGELGGRGRGRISARAGSHRKYLAQPRPRGLRSPT